MNEIAKKILCSELSVEREVSELTCLTCSRLSNLCHLVFLTFQSSQGTSQPAIGITASN